MCLLKSLFIALHMKKPSVKRIPQDKGATGHVQNEEASKGFSDNLLVSLSWGFTHFLGNPFLPLTNHTTFLLSCSWPYLSVRIYFL